jgi:hypothetical protein
VAFVVLRSTPHTDGWVGLLQLRTSKAKGWVWNAQKGIRVFDPKALALDQAAMNERELDEESGGLKSSPKSPAGTAKSPKPPPRPTHLRQSSHAPNPPMLSLCQSLLLVVRAHADVIPHSGVVTPARGGVMWNGQMSPSTFHGCTRITIGSPARAQSPHILTT